MESDLPEVASWGEAVSPGTEARGSMPRVRGKVVRVIARLNVGGPAVHVINLSHGLAERFPTVLVAGEVDSGEADMSRRAEELGVTLVRVPELGRRIRPWQDVIAFLKLVRLFLRLRPSIVHTHTAKAGTLGRLAALVCGVPVRVHTFHGHVFRGYFPGAATRMVIWAERLLARITTRVVAISPSQAEEISGEFRICPPKKLAVVPLGFELDHFGGEGSATLSADFRREVAAGGRAVVSIVGRLVPIKNHALFLEAAAALARAGHDCVFVVVGGGPEESVLRRRAKELEIGERVRFLGWRTDLARIYAGSDVVALTSNNEGTPVCLIEALAAGRAVVATDVGGVRDVLEDGRLGLLVPPGDPVDLSKALARLVSNPELRSRFGEQGAASVRERYGVDRLLKDLDGLYLDLLAGSGRARERYTRTFTRQH